jgi:hypothetical protein
MQFSFSVFIVPAGCGTGMAKLLQPGVFLHSRSVRHLQRENSYQAQSPPPRLARTKARELGSRQRLRISSIKQCDSPPIMPLGKE